MSGWLCLAIQAAYPMLSEMLAGWYQNANFSISRSGLTTPAIQGAHDLYPTGLMTSDTHRKHPQTAINQAQSTPPDKIRQTPYKFNKAHYQIPAVGFCEYERSVTSLALKSTQECRENPIVTLSCFQENGGMALSPTGADCRRIQMSV